MKNQGSVLLYTFVLGSLIMMVALAGLRLVVRDTQVTTNFFLSENAYFLAESGLEKALITLQKNPTAHIKDQQTKTDNGVLNLNIVNQKNTFEIELRPHESTKMRLRYDANAAETTLNKPTTDFDLTVNTVPGAVDLNWKILCPSGDTTVSIQGELMDGYYPGVLGSLSGRYDDSASPTSKRTIIEFMNTLTESEKVSCFLSFYNVSNVNTLSLEVKSMTLAPPKAHIISRAQSRSRSKTIQFDYQQKNLREIFDFVFFQN